jgi:hypothetical protein
MFIGQDPIDPLDAFRVSVAIAVDMLRSQH